MHERSSSRFGASSSRIRFRSSHRKTIALRVSHTRPGSWQPPVKDRDEEDDRPSFSSKGKKKRR